MFEKGAGKIKRISVTASVGSFLDRKVGITEKFFGVCHSDLRQIPDGRGLQMVFEKPLQFGLAAFRCPADHFKVYGAAEI